MFDVFQVTGGSAGPGGVLHGGPAHRAHLGVPGSDRAVTAQCPRRRLLGVRHRRLGGEGSRLRRLLAGDRVGDLVACTMGPARGAPP